MAAFFFGAKRVNEFRVLRILPLQSSFLSAVSSLC